MNTQRVLASPHSVKTSSWGKMLWVVVCTCFVAILMSLAVSAVSSAGVASAYADDTAGASTGDAAASSSIQVGGTDYYGDFSTTSGSSTKVDVVAVQAPKGSTLYFDVYKLGENGSKQYLAKRYSWNLSNAEATDSDDQVGSARIDVSLLLGSDKQLVSEGEIEKYRVAVYWDSNTRANPKVFKLYGVYADLYKADEKVGTKLIGLRTFPEGTTETTRHYDPQQNYYDATANNGQGQSYGLRSFKPSTDLNPTFNYYAYDPATSLTGTVTFVDDNGNVIRTNQLSGVSEGHDVTYKIPSMIKIQDEKDADAYTYYRPVTTLTEVTFKYPSKLDYTIHCVRVIDSSSIEDGYVPYTLNIQYITRTTDGDGTTTETIVLTDTVQINKKNIYTLPTNFYSSHVDGADTSVVTTYTLDGGATEKSVRGIVNCSATFDASNNELTIQPHTKSEVSTESTDAATETIQVVYTHDEPKGNNAEYIICCWDASKSAGQATGGTRPTLMKKEIITVEPGSDKTYTPAASLTNADGTELVLFGEPTEITLKNENGQNEQRVINYYYVEEGAQYAEDYDVTVQYVDVANNKVLDSHTITIPGNSTADVTIPTGPEKLTANDKEYVRLDGQSASFSHSYVAPYRTYTIYYRDANDDTYANTVVTRTVILESDADDSATNTENGRVVGLEEGASLTRVANADETNPNDANANGELLTEDGTDTATQREINDDENPLAGSSQEDTSFLPTNVVYGILIGAAVLVLLLAWVLYKRRKKNAEQ